MADWTPPAGRPSSLCTWDNNNYSNNNSISAHCRVLYGGQKPFHIRHLHLTLEKAADSGEGSRASTAKRRQVRPPLHADGGPGFGVPCWDDLSWPEPPARTPSQSPDFQRLSWLHGQPAGSLTAAAPTTSYNTPKKELKLKPQSFGHLMQRADSLGQTLMLGKIEGRRRRGRQRIRWLDGIPGSMDMS